LLTRLRVQRCRGGMVKIGATHPCIVMRVSDGGVCLRTHLPVSLALLLPRRRFRRTIVRRLPFTSRIFMTSPVLSSSQVAARPASYPQRLGVHLASGGVDVLVHAPAAHAVYFCLFDGESEEQTALLPTSHGGWSGHIPGVQAGAVYGFRVDGDYDRPAGKAF